MSSENKDIYVDLLCSNQRQSNYNTKTQIQFNQQQSQPILNNTNGYKLSIIRFYLNTDLLPVFIPTLLNPVTDKVACIYSFTMEYLGVMYQQYLQFVPQNTSVSSSETDYYYVYNYQYVVYLINQCLLQCFNGLQSKATLPTASAPYIDMDLATQKCSLHGDSKYFGYNETNKINIYMNSAMYNLLVSMPITISNKSNGREFQFCNIMSKDKSVLTQEFNSISIWNPIASVIFTSDMLPIYSSRTPPIQQFIDGVITNTDSNLNVSNIVTDFMANDMIFSPYIEYEPSVYRFISLKPNTELRTVDFKVFWINKHDGLMRPVNILPGGSCSCKLYLCPI